MNQISTVRTDRAPVPAGHYSQAVVHNGLVFVSGQLPLVAGTGTAIAGQGGAPAPIEAQTRQTLTNLSAVLQAAGSSLDRVLKVTVFVSDVALWPAVNGVYAEVFGDHKPARSVVPSGRLRHGCDIEIEAIAAVGAGGEQ